MADRARPALASVTIRRLVLPSRETGQDLGSAIGAALARGPWIASAGGTPQAGTAQAIARAIADHPEIAAIGVGSGRTGDGDR